MIRAGAGLSTASDPIRAVREAAEQALARSGPPEAALLFAGPGSGDLEAQLREACDCLGTTAVVGASAQGVLAAGRECEGAPAVSLLAVAGVEIEPFLLEDLAGDEARAGEEISARLGEPRPEDLVVLFPDPTALRPEPLLSGVRSALAPAQIIGAGAVDALAARPLQWLGARVASGALSGCVLRAPSRPRIGVTQACRPVTKLLTATRTRGNWLLEIDGRPALEAFREAARGRLADELERAAAFVLVALPCDREASLRPGSYLARHVIGFAPEEGAFALPEILETGQSLGFAVREPETARDDLKAMLAEIAPAGAPEPALALYLDCCARGASFFGVPGLEAAYLESHLGEAPVAGMFGSCEIGPIAGRLELLTYTGVLARIDEPR